MTRITIDIPGFSGNQVALLGQLKEILLSASRSMGFNAASATVATLATEGQIDDAITQYGSDFQFETRPAVRHNPDPAKTGGVDFFWIQAWVPVDGGEQPVTLERVRFAALEEGYADNPEFHKRALAHIEAEWSPGHYMGLEDLRDAITDYADNQEA